jgi:hypothetical protein
MLLDTLPLYSEEIQVREHQLLSYYTIMSYHKSQSTIGREDSIRTELQQQLSILKSPRSLRVREDSAVRIMNT